MTFYTPRTENRRRTAEVRRERPARRPSRPKTVAALLAVSTLLLIGGGVFAATRPTWRPVMSNAGKVTGRLAAGTAVSAVAQAAHASAGLASAAQHAQNSAPAASVGRPASAPHASRSGSAVIPRTPRRGTTKPIAVYTVKSGDTLYGIAKWFRLHGYGRLYAANRSVIGSNPSLIIPGERIMISHSGVMSLHPASGQQSTAS